MSQKNKQDFKDDSETGAGEGSAVGGDNVSKPADILNLVHKPNMTSIQIEKLVELLLKNESALIGFMNRLRNNKIAASHVKAIVNLLAKKFSKVPKATMILAQIFDATPNQSLKNEMRKNLKATNEDLANQVYKMQPQGSLKKNKSYLPNPFPTKPKPE